MLRLLPHPPDRVGTLALRTHLPRHRRQLCPGACRLGTQRWRIGTASAPNASVRTAAAGNAAVATARAAAVAANVPSPTVASAIASALAAVLAATSPPRLFGWRRRSSPAAALYGRRVSSFGGEVPGSAVPGRLLLGATLLRGSPARLPPPLGGATGRASPSAAARGAAHAAHPRALLFPPRAEGARAVSTRVHRRVGRRCAACAAAARPAG
mmetsp:Transcript_20024/g.63960  ORF Transcript_20024/g.63960 Transcript_20024/m.63960 type:complete len:212 (+) Transcript_20024:504-1139(+)